MSKLNSVMSMKLWLTFSLVFLSGCTVVTTKDYIHKETAKNRTAVLWGTGDIELDKPFQLIPNFRRFARDSPSSPSLIILAQQAIDVRIKNVRLIGPNGSPDEVIEIDKVVSLKNKQIRETTMQERMASGGFFKGKRVVDTDYFVASQPLPLEPSEFNTLSPLRLEVVASIEEGSFETYSFELVYRKRTGPTFITR